MKTMRNMELRRTHSSESREFRLSRKDKGPKVTKHPGFMSISPRSSSANTSSPGSDESKRSSCPSGFHNTMTPLSSHLMSSGFSNSFGSARDYSKPSSSKSFPATEENKLYQASSAKKDKSQYHTKCAHSREREQSRVSTPKIRALSKPLSPSTPKGRCESIPSQSVNYQMAILKEKYAKLKEDYNAKMEEVSTSRVELENAIKQAVDRHKRCEEAEKKAADLILRVKEAEFEKIKCSSSRDRIVEMDNQLTLAKQKHNDSIEDVVEAKRILKEQLEAVDNMRRLYLETEQLAEEQSRKLSTLELENERLTEQIALSMDLAREQFQAQVFELGPLADSVSRLNEGIIINKEKKARADKRAEGLTTEMMHLTNRNDELKRQLAELREHFTTMDTEKLTLREKIDGKQEERAEAKAENYSLKAKIKDLEELNIDKETKINMKENEVKDLSARLETLREECARQISSNKNTLANARKSNLKRLTALEKDLARTKADENTAEKERDEIRMRLEDQIASLSQNLSAAQEKIRNLQDSLGYINKDRNVKVRRLSNSHGKL